MRHFHRKTWISFILVFALFVGFCSGVLTQRAGIPGRIKRIIFKPEPSYLPITIIEEVEHKEPCTVWLRKFPYPFKSALSIASDIDYCSLEEFDEIHRFLNTTEITNMGPGLGLDIADSMWMYDISDVYPCGDIPPSMSYWKGIKPGAIKNAARIREYVQNGWIDSLHTYGEFSRIENVFRRELAEAALEELASKDIFLDVWIDHGDQYNRQNFAQYYRRPYQQGDDPNSPAYHTDLLIAYGMRYAWGPERREFGTEELAVPLTLRDGRKIWQFGRYTRNNVGRAGYNWFPNNIHRQLTEENLKKLIENNLWEILTNHFGAPTPREGGRVKTRPPFGPAARKALRLLAYEFRRGNIMVLRTSRLLKYYVVSKHLDWDYDSDNNTIYINAIDDPVVGRYVPELADLRGITFHISSPIRSDIILGDTRLEGADIVWNAHDGTAYSVSIRPYFSYH